MYVPMYAYTPGSEDCEDDRWAPECWKLPYWLMRGMFEVAKQLVVILLRQMPIEAPPTHSKMHQQTHNACWSLKLRLLVQAAGLRKQSEICFFTGGPVEKNRRLVDCKDITDLEAQP